MVTLLYDNRDMIGMNPSQRSRARPLILASSSRYRRELLQRLGLPFESISPQVDESPEPGESAPELARRLAGAKADKVAAAHPAALVLGSDQVLDFGGQPEGKPGSHARAVAQLRRLSGQRVIFHTAVAVRCLDTGLAGNDAAQIRVRFRRLNEAEIERYLRADEPYDCAGSARSESLGIALLDSIESDDPTALIGLPLIRTAALLRQAGLTIP